jgi:hypothetical protein
MTRNRLTCPRCVCGWACVAHPHVVDTFWALAPYIAHSLSGLSNPPSVAAVTTAFVSDADLRIALEEAGRTS